MAHPTVAQTRALNVPHGRSAALLLSLALAATGLAAAAPVRAAGGDGLRQEANAHRVAAGLNPVGGTALLDDIATHRAAQMVAAGSMEHNFEYVSDRLNASGTCWSGYGEIIAWSPSPDYSYESTMQQWWGSKVHHHILMTAAYNAAGAAWQTASDGDHYSVMVFVVLCGNSISRAGVPMLKLDRRYNPDRPMVFREGTFTGYRLGAGGEVLSRKSVHFGSWHRTTSAGRTLVNGRAWLKVSGGPLAGYWVHESADSYVRGKTAHKVFEPAEWLVVQPGKYTAFKFDWLGGPIAQKVFRASWPVKMHTTGKAIISGRPYYLVSSGPLDGFWLRNSYNVDLR